MDNPGHYDEYPELTAMTPKSPAPIDSAKVEDTGEPEIVGSGDMSFEEAAERGRCTVPPDGWMCSREKGHEGPCAATPSTQAVGEPWQVGDDTSSVQISRDGSTHKWGCKCEGCAPTTGSAPIAYRFRHSETEKWYYDATPRNLWECEPLYAAPASPAASVLTDEQIARVIWAIRREDEDRCDMELEDMGADHSVWKEAQAIVALLAASMGGDKS